MQRHTIMGEQIIAPSALHGRAHARLCAITTSGWTAKATPTAWWGTRFHSGARIVAIADGYAAMLAHRPYRGALSPAKALATLQAGRRQAVGRASRQASSSIWAQRQPPHSPGPEVIARHFPLIPRACFSQSPRSGNPCPTHPYALRAL